MLLCTRLISGNKSKLLIKYKFIIIIAVLKGLECICESEEISLNSLMSSCFYKNDILPNDKPNDN